MFNKSRAMFLLQSDWRGQIGSRPATLVALCEFKKKALTRQTNSGNDLQLAVGTTTSIRNGNNVQIYAYWPRQKSRRR